MYSSLFIHPTWNRLQQGHLWTSTDAKSARIEGLYKVTGQSFVRLFFSVLDRTERVRRPCNGTVACMLSLQLTSSTLCSCDSFVFALLQVCADYTFWQNNPQFMEMPPSMSISRIKSTFKQWLRLKVFGAGHHFFEIFLSNKMSFSEAT